MNNNGHFKFVPFTVEAQFSPINSIIFYDFDNDSVKDLLLAGNNYASEVETTRADAGTGVFLKGIKDNAFEYQANLETGFYANGDVKNIVLLEQGQSKAVLVANNNGRHQLYKIER